MKKKMLFICMVFSLAVSLCLALLCACGPQTDTGESSEQRKFYDAYVAYATAEGDDVISYEEWLESIRGKDGKDGLNGKDGKDGADGKSAYDIWQENGHSGSESDFLDWLKGEKGDTGAVGAQGQKGDTGEQGPAGPQGQKGDKGDDGANGIDGQNGKDGNDGADGKSAYDIWQENGHSGSESDFLEWLKGEKGDDGANGTDGKDGQDGKDGLSAFELFKKYYPFYDGNEEDWIADLVNGNLTIYKVTFKSEVADDIVRRVFTGRDLTDIPAVPEKEGQESAKWDRSDFTNITSDIEVHAVYTMKQLTVTFHNEFTEDADIVRQVEYGQAIKNVPTVKAKAYNSGSWDITDFSRITKNMTVNAVYETIGFSYTLINNQQEYRVSAGTMNKETKELFIPAVHDQKPVTVIAERAFENEKFTSAYLPESITEIRSYAFYNCDYLQNIKIPSKISKIDNSVFNSCVALENIDMPNVNAIGIMAFSDCAKLQSIKMPSVTEIGGMAFYRCTKLQSIDMPNVTEIGSQAFSGCEALEHLEIPSGVTDIKFGLFENCTSLKYIILPSVINYIGDVTLKIGVCSGCSVFEAIYYKGDAKKWAAIDKSSAGGVFNDAKVYYYAAQMPEANEGDYWHYDEDEKTPLVWKK